MTCINVKHKVFQENPTQCRQEGAPQEYFYPKSISNASQRGTLRTRGAPQEYFHALRTRGAAMLIFVLFFAITSSAMMFTLNQSIYIDFKDFNRLTQAKQSLLTSESLLEDVLYRNIFDPFAVDTVESLTFANTTAYATTTYDSANDQYVTESLASFGQVKRKSTATLILTGGSSFNYGLQAGTGGIMLANSSSIVGNVYSNGTVTGAGSARVSGDIVSAGSAGVVQTIRATGSVYSNSINRINAGLNAYYNIQIGTNAQNPVAGTRYTPVTNQPIADLPISTTTIQGWKDDVTTYGTVITAANPLCSTGTYTINTNIAIGFLKVECNLDIRKNGAGTTVTLNGPIWVSGNLSFTQGPIIRVNPSLGRKSVQFIVDNPSNRLTSSRIELRNSTQFNGSGDSRSFVMLLSMNESAALGGTQKAIDVSQSANGKVLVYTPRGLVDIGNGIALKEVTGYKVNVAQNASVIYESGLASLLFTAGPGGGYSLEDWRQVE